MTGPAQLLAPIIKAHQFLVFTVPSNLQRAVAYGLTNEQEFYKCVALALASRTCLCHLEAGQSCISMVLCRSPHEACIDRALPFWSAA